jgi:putative isomerase
MRLSLELIFSDSRQALVRGRLVNEGSEPAEVGLGWVGGGFFLPVSLHALQGGVRIELPGTGSVVEVRRLDGNGLPNTTDEAEYRIPGSPVSLGPGDVYTEFLSISLEPTGEGEPVLEPDMAFAENRARWIAYLWHVLGPRGPTAAEGPSNRQWVGAKAIQTLISNWRSPRGHLFHAGLFPSYAYRGFHGVWSWDSWKHARALALFQPELAKDQMRVMLDHQNEVGMIPDVIYVDSTRNNWRDTKPPLSVWAVRGIFAATSDTAFVAEVYPALRRYHEWWYRFRDHDGNGLCEYGSTDGTRIAAAWESGMDNAVRFDEAVMVQNGPEAWSLNQESVDLNAYLYAEKGFLADLAEALDRDGEAQALRSEAEGLKSEIRNLMFDRETGYFYDIDLETKDPIRVQGPEGWIPLWAGVATQVQAEAVVRVMTDPAKFAGTLPFPTLAMDRPEFDPLDGYWRGPVWLDQAYFAVKALERYGFDTEAGDLAARLMEAPSGLTGQAPIYENYHPVTGEGLNAPHFSWSAAHLLMLVKEGW